MILNELLTIDSSLQVQKGDLTFPISFPGSSTHFLDNGFSFIKSDKFYQKFKQYFSLKSVQGYGLILDQKFYNALSEDDLSWLSENIDWMAITVDIPQSIIILSKFFYDRKYAEINFQVDGRIMGESQIHPTAQIAQNAFIGNSVHIEEGVIIHPGVVVESFVTIKKNTILFSNVCIYSFVTIGENCRIHANSTIGADGFGYTFHQGVHQKIWHFGGVEISNNVEIGSNSSVDAGTFMPTFIGEGTKIDNLVQVAHNCYVGKHCILCGASGLAGSVYLEDYVVLGGKAGVGPDSFLGKGTQVAGGALVNEGASWPAASRLGGHPARDLKEWMRGFAYLRKMSLKK